MEVSIIQIFISLISCGVITSIITLYVNRRIRKKEGIKALSETIDFLIGKNTELIETVVKLKEEMADLKVQLPQNRSQRRSYTHPKNRKKNICLYKNEKDEDNEISDESIAIFDDDDEPP